MRNFVKFSMLALVAIATTASAAELEFHGYTRAGIGLNSDGGRAVCYGLPGGSVGNIRLGNECDYVIEPNFEYKFVTLEDKSAWGYHFMPSIYKGWGAQTQTTTGGGTTYWYDDLPVRFGQVYFFGSNVPQLLNGTIWGGRRFYDRLQTGINDQFLENEDGDGAGVENMDLGFAKWSVAWLMNPNDSAGVTEGAVGSRTNKTMKLTTRFTDIKTVKDGALQLWFGALNLQSKASGGDKVEATYRIGVYHTLNLGDLGSNLLAFKYETTKDFYRWRALVQHGITFASAKTSLDVVGEFVQAKAKGAKAVNQFLVMARTDTQISGPFRFLLEAGYHNIGKDPSRSVKPDGSINLLKVTPVLAISGGNDPWSRPTFRAYYTFANASEEGLVGIKTDKKSSSSYGIQAEGWW